MRPLPLLAAALVATHAGPASSTRPPACTAPEYRQFDFFAGDWDTYDVGGPDTAVARNRVTPMVGGCALREVYEQKDGLHGESFSTWDAARGVWHQSWVTNRGQLLLMDGRFENGRMSFTTMPGAPQTIRAVWWKDGATVREKAETTQDGGTSWETLFDIVFRPHRTSRRG